MRKKREIWSTESFSEKCKEIYNNKYDYTKLLYVNSLTKVCIICPEHGEFWKKPANHLGGEGCPKCGYKAGTLAISDTKEEFCDKANKKHNNFYNYDKSIYVNAHTKLIITCPLHGDFEQPAYSHLNGRGCRICGNLNKGSNKKISHSEFITRAVAKHGTTYDYSKTIYKKYHEKVTIICLEHGEFSQESASHLSGIGCPKCGIVKNKIKRTMPLEDFINKANETHNSTYDYSKSNYETSALKLCIICPKHGEFWQKPNDHLSGHGCPNCCHHVSSHNDIVTKFLSDNKISFEESNRVILGNGHEVDVLIRDKKLGIEVNGCYWHSEKYKDNYYHINKTTAAESAGFHLLHIWDYEIEEKWEIIKSRLASYLGINKKIYAKECLIKPLESAEAKNFCDTNHLQGGIYCSVNYGLFNGTELVSVMAFSKPRFNKNYDYELVRYCSKNFINVIGGASRLFSLFEKEHPEVKVISYADRRFTHLENNLYKSLEFTFMSQSKPNYFWYRSNCRVSRVQAQKQNAVKILENYDSALTETENFKNNGYLRVFDCGNAVFEKVTKKLL